ncbi:MAG: MarR family winged helix-turn-helix transcriptional regulator [Candidatus Hadarchaeota archaeon]
MRKNVGATALFLQEKPVNTMIFLKKENKPVYQTKIAKNIESTYAHTYNVLKDLESLKLVVFRKSGRLKLVKLTETGEEATDALMTFLEVAALGEIEREIDLLYEKEIKAKLREEINKTDVEQKLNNLKLKLKEYFDNKQKNISILARKLSKKISDVLVETFGYPPEV